MIARPDRTARQLGVAVAIVLVGAIALASVASGQFEETGGRAPGQSRPFMDIFDPAKPLMLDGAGKETTLSAAAEEAGYPILRPVSAGEPSEVWIGEAGEGRFEVGLRYEGKLVVLLSPWPEGDDPEASLESKVDAYRAGYTTTIDGHPAWVRPYDETKDSAPVDAVHVAVRGVEVTLFGTTGIDDLLAYAGDLSD